MKALIVVFLVGFQTIISSSALAWSPLDGFEAVVDDMRLCKYTVTSSDESQEGKTEEETEEEPDCE